MDFMLSGLSDAVKRWQAWKGGVTIDEDKSAGRVWGINPSLRA
jgi:hypothetical protein